MLPKDNFYKLILSYKLPISRGKQPVKIFLKQYFEQYINRFRNALIRTDECDLDEECYTYIASKLPILEELCADILKVYDYHDSGEMVKMYIHFSEMMNKIEPLMSIKNIGNVGYESFRGYYRIRAGKDEYNRKDMFHIPMDMRHLIKSYRYSIPGYPCLYLASGAELCWFECGMPKEFSYAGFVLDIEDDKRVRIIDFSMLPLDVAWAIYLENINHKENRQYAYEFLAKYLLLLPLKAACSMRVSNRDVAFVEEYIFPQQLLLWVRENGKYDGIAYRTSSSIEKSKEWNYINLVLPAKTIENGYCSHLNSILKVTKPVKVKISSFMEKYSRKISDVKEFAEYLENEGLHGSFFYPYREIISMCRTFIKMCDMLANESYIDAEAIYQTLETLNLAIDMVQDNLDSVINKSISEVKKVYSDEDDEHIQKEVSEIMDYFFSKVKPTVFDMWDYYFRVFCDNPLDFNSYERIM